jgi:hypothetical protein
MREVEVAVIRASIISICIAGLFYLSVQQIFPTLQFPLVNFVAYTALFGVFSSLGFRLNEYVVRGFPQIFQNRFEKYAITEQKIFFPGSQNSVKLLQEYTNLRFVYSDTKEMTTVQLIKYPHVLNLPLPEEPLKTQVLDILRKKMVAWKYEKAPEEYVSQSMRLESPFDILLYVASFFWAVFLGGFLEQQIAVHHWNALAAMVIPCFVGPGTYWAAMLKINFDPMSSPTRPGEFFWLLFFGNLLSAQLTLVYIMLFYLHRIAP